MDMEILLRLQEFRNGAGAILADFLSKMTFLGELNTAIVIMSIIYWSVSKELGTYLMMGWSGNRLANDTFRGVGYCTAFLVGWVLERRFVCFSTDVSLELKLSRAVIGILGYYVVSLILDPMIKTWI